MHAAAPLLGSLPPCQQRRALMEYYSILILLCKMTKSVDPWLSLASLLGPLDQLIPELRRCLRGHHEIAAQLPYNRISAVP